MKEKLLSVIIPTYKGQESLTTALESLKRQTYKNIEVVVSDDNGVGTNDQRETQVIVDSFADSLNIVYLANEHVNGSHARNKGLENAKGDFIAFLDDDDYYLEKYAENAIKAFEENDDAYFVFFDVAIVTRENVSRLVQNETITSKEFLFGRKEIGTGSNICFRKEAYIEDGGFDERYLRYQDIEFIVKKLHRYKSVWINKVCVVKYYNQIENYLNYKKSLTMQKLLRDDMRENGILSENDYVTLKNNQLHGLYNDMLAKEMDKNDIEIVYNMLKDDSLLKPLDKAMFFVYSKSKKLFKTVFDLFMKGKSKKYDFDFGEVIKYRKKLENAD